MLSDPKKREIYDRGGEKGIKEGGSSDGGSGSFASPMDIFDLLFGGGLRVRRERKGTVKYSKVVFLVIERCTFITFAYILCSIYIFSPFFIPPLQYYK